MKYPGRLRLFLGFVFMAFYSLFYPQRSAEIIALGLKEQQNLRKKRYMETMTALIKRKKRRGF